MTRDDACCGTCVWHVWEYWRSKPPKRWICDCSQSLEYKHVTGYPDVCDHYERRADD